jgi:HD-GYP domain-containing protein (c-di-GMP phosphodiesterase class II)
MKKNILLFVFLLTFLTIYSQKINILFLHSYNKGYEWTDSIDRGFRENFIFDHNFEIFTEYMDSRRLINQNLDYFSEYLKIKYSSIVFDLIITSDDEALDFVIENRNDLFPNDLLTIFTGINNLAKYTFENHEYYRGILKKIKLKENIDLALTLFPKTNKIYFISDNKTDAGINNIYLINYYSRYYENIDFEILDDILIDDLKVNVSNAENDSLIFLLTFSMDKNLTIYTAKQISEIVVNNTDNPIFTLWDFYSFDGILGGLITSGFEEGKLAANIAKKFLNNKNIEFINFVSDVSVIPIFNWDKIKYFNLNEYIFPNNTIFLNKKLNFFERNRISIIIILFLSLVFLTIISFQKSTLKKFKVLTQRISEQKNTLIQNNEEMYALNEELESLYENNNFLNDKLNGIIKMIGNLENEKVEIDSYYEEVLNYCIQLIPNSNFALLAFIQGEDWTFAATVGEIVERFKNIKVKLKNKNVVLNKTELIRDFSTTILNDDFLKEISYVFKNNNTVVTHTFEVSKNRKMNISVGVPIEGFSENSEIIFNSFITLIKTFVKNRYQINALKNTYLNFAKKLASIAEAHDDITGKHVFRVGEMSAFLSYKYGKDEEFIDKIRKFSPLHDIGKIYIESEILNKPSKLTEDEWEKLKKHTIYGEKILDDDYFYMARNIAKYHHEKYNGGGYPEGLVGDEIPIEAQIVSIIDVYDALRSKRSYKEAFSHEKAVEIIKIGDNKTDSDQFNPEIRRIFLENHEIFDKIYEKLKDK